MNDLQVFNYHDKPIRTIERNGEVWWVLKDVCGAMEIADHVTVAKRLDNDEVGQTQVIDAKGRGQPTYIVNEPGLYNVILRSDKPEAKDFKRWVTHEVLPSIRRTGQYSLPSVPKRIPEVSPSGLAKLITVTRQVMLDMGNSPLEIGAMTKSVLETWGIPVPAAFSNQIPGQLCLFDRQEMGG